MIEAVLLLANSGEATPNGLVSALGIGWSQCTTPTPPMALVLMLKIPWDRTNERIKFTLALLDEDGHPAALGTDPLGNPSHLRIDGDIEAGRPAGLKPGTPIDMGQVIGLAPGMPLPPGGYEWRLEVDGQPAASRAFRALPAPTPT